MTTSYYLDPVLNIQTRVPPPTKKREKVIFDENKRVWLNRDSKNGQLYIANFSTSKRKQSPKEQSTPSLHYLDVQRQWVSAALTKFRQLIKSNEPCSIADNMVDFRLLSDKEKNSASDTVIAFARLILGDKYSTMVNKYPNINEVVLKIFPFPSVSNLDSSLQVEVAIYAHVSHNLIAHQHTPHLIQYLADFQCRWTSLQFQNKKERTKLKNSSKEFQESEQVVILVAEKSNGKSLSKMIKEHNFKNLEEVLLVVFQVMWTLACFNRVYMRHNDLHNGNVFVETLDEPVTLFYDLGDEGMVEITSHFMVKIYDFDRGTVYHPLVPRNTLNDLEYICTPACVSSLKVSDKARIKFVKDDYNYNTCSRLSTTFDCTGFVWSIVNTFDETIKANPGNHTLLQFGSDVVEWLLSGYDKKLVTIMIESKNLVDQQTKRDKNFILYPQIIQTLQMETYVAQNNIVLPDPMVFVRRIVKDLKFPTTKQDNTRGWTLPIEPTIEWRSPRLQTLNYIEQTFDQVYEQPPMSFLHKFGAFMMGNQPFHTSSPTLVPEFHRIRNIRGGLSPENEKILSSFNKPLQDDEEELIKQRYLKYHFPYQKHLSMNNPPDVIWRRVDIELDVTLVIKDRDEKERDWDTLMYLWITEMDELKKHAKFKAFDFQKLRQSVARDYAVKIQHQFDDVKEWMILLKAASLFSVPMVYTYPTNMRKLILFSCGHDVFNIYVDLFRKLDVSKYKLPVLNLWSD